MLGVKCSRFSASGQQYCDETAGGLDPVNTANSAPWRSASSIGSSRSSSSRSSGGSWVMSAPALTPHLDYDDELFYEGNKPTAVLALGYVTSVVWSTGSIDGTVVRKVYTVETEVTSALWCVMDEQRTFDDGVAATAAAHRTLCVVEADTVTLFSASGAIFVVPIPFKVGCVMPLDKGLLLERFVANADGNDGDDDGVGRRQTAGSASPVPSADSAGEPDLQPTMFTLLYGKLRPVGFPTSESSPPHAGAWSLLHVARAVSPPVAVVYNHASGAHAVCTMARIPPPSTTSADPNELFPE
eukprot:gene12295-14340_t